MAGRQAWRNVLVPRSTVPVSPNEAIHGPKWPILGLITFAYYATILNRRPFLARASAQSRRIQRSHSSLPVSTAALPSNALEFRNVRSASSLRIFRFLSPFRMISFFRNVQSSISTEDCLSLSFPKRKTFESNSLLTVNRQLETKYVEAASASILNLFFVLNLSCNNLSNLDFCLILSIYLIKKRANYYNN